MNIIEAENLSKSFAVKISDATGMKGVFNALFRRQTRIVEAVKDISFSVSEGEILGFIGPNGAGKSTTIKMLTGILTPTEGSIKICGIIPYKDRISNAKNIGAVFGQRTQLWWDLPVIESFQLLKKIYQIDDGTYQENLDFFIKTLDMGEFIRQPVRQLSLGQRMRSDIAAAFLHNPRIIYLDEPTIGLDIPAKRKMHEFIHDINERQKATVILTTHDMQEIEELCHRVMVINHGTIIYNGTVADMRMNYHAKNELTFKLRQEVAGLDLACFHEELRWHARGADLHITAPESVPAGEVISYIANRYEILDVEIAKTSIEDIIEEVFER